MLRRVDMVSKRFEFEAWLREVKRLVEFRGGKRETEELFAEFCEEWNMCTLGRKYYDLEKHEREQVEASRGGGGRGGGDAGGGFSLAREDEERRGAAALEAQRRVRERAELLKAAASARASDPNVKKREDLIAGARYAFLKGDSKEQQRLLAKIADMDKEVEAAKWR